MDTESFWPLMRMTPAYRTGYIVSGLLVCAMTLTAMAVIGVNYWTLGANLVIPMIWGPIAMRACIAWSRKHARLQH